LEEYRTEVLYNGLSMLGFALSNHIIIFGGISK
jgi:hypothetical protein